MIGLGHKKALNLLIRSKVDKKHEHRQGETKYGVKSHHMHTSEDLAQSWT